MTLFVVCNIHDDLKGTSIEMKNRDVDEELSTPKYSIDEDIMDKLVFSVNIYSVYYDANNNLVMSVLLEVDDPDGVFIIIEINFKVTGI